MSLLACCHSNPIDNSNHSLLRQLLQQYAMLVSNCHSRALRTMAKKQYNTRIEPEAIENLQTLKEDLDCSVPDLLESLIFWAAGNDRALANCPLQVRELLAARGGGGIAGVADAPHLADVQAAIYAATAPLLVRLEAVEGELKNGEGVTAA